MLDPLLVAGLGRAGGKPRSVHGRHRIGLPTPPSRALSCMISAAGFLRLPDGSTVEVDDYAGSIQVVS